MSGLLTIVYPSTLADQKARIVAAAAGTDSSVKSCLKLDPTIVANWSLFYAALSAFFQEDPGVWGWGSRYERGEAYEVELVAWQERLQAAGCVLAVPIVHPPPAADITRIFQYAAWGAGFVAVAYVVGKVAPFVPHPAPAEGSWSRVKGSLFGRVSAAVPPMAKEAARMHRRVRGMLGA